MRHHALACILSLAAAQATACETALVLAVDVSNSVDPAEYRLQVDGMADAFLDGEVAEAMVLGEVAIAVMQWSGAERQEVSIPWTRITSYADVEALSARARAIPRAFILSDTAPAEAVHAAIDLLAEVPDCTRHVIDVSGDGTPNAGSSVTEARSRAGLAGITINGIAIESMGLAITGFFTRSLITADGFVITARGHRDYPRAIRNKILRELSLGVG
jgi:Ca-activated chloride channel family protein